ncbi:piwi domain protein [Dictyocaulus viviparus]|uniref:Piwi domain protein n=1 Tax=Dictyocaulus viviparus TaxID=29172 RepID=A0A0D8XGU8_DICVI|nr:piwi domain protein [Dictyocaulus viviparus]
MKTVAVPEKRPSGNRGMKTEFLTNITKLSLKPNVPFFKYDVRMYVVYKGTDGREHLKELTKQTKDDFPEQQRKSLAVLVYKHLIKSYPDVFLKGVALFYDRASVLFSAQRQIKLAAEKEEFIVPASILSNACGDAEKVCVVIKKVSDSFQVTSNDIMKAVNVREFERDKNILEVLNLAVSQEGYLETDNELPELMDGKYMGIGLSKSVKVLEGENGKCGPFFVADVTKSAFHADEQNLLDKISQMSVFLDRRTGAYNFSVDVACKPYNMKNILQLLKGLYVKTSYGKTRTFPIGNLAPAANILRFQASDGNQYTVEQYFKKHYNIKLKYPSLFTVSERHNPHTYYPVELLFVAPSQRVTSQQQTPEDVAAIIKASATLPQHRLNQTKVMKDALKMVPGNTYLEAAGITVDKDFAKVVGRVLPAPTVVYGRSETIAVNECKWNWDRSQFIQPGNLSNWAVCATLTPNDSGRIKIREYISRVESRCRSHGMKIEAAAEIFYLKRQTFEELKIDLIKLLEVQYQIVSQEVKASKVDAVMFKNQNQTLDNVVAKINEKIGGVNYNITLNTAAGDNNCLSDSGVLFIGFEISNPPSSSKTEIPSVLGWGANCASNPQQFIGDYVYVEARQSDMMGSKLAGVVMDIIERHRLATKTAIRHLIFYFSGISEGQFGMIPDSYMRAINTGLSSLSPQCVACVTALAVSKDHNERIYRANITGKRAADQNIPGGTVVDTKIVSPVMNEFYLNAHSAFQGTARTPKYSLLADNSMMPLDVIEGLTYGLCYLHEIVSATVSVPAPLIVADRCAKRGHNIYLANMKEKQVVVGTIKEANEKLVNRGDLKKVRYNA